MKARVPFLPVETGNQNAAGSQETVVNAPNTIVKQPLDPRHVPADLSQTHLSGAQTEEAAVRKGQKTELEQYVKDLLECVIKDSEMTDIVMSLKKTLSTRKDPTMW